MARKLFISFLGTTFYKECVYFDSATEEKFPKTKYIQSAVLEQIGAREWGAEDAIRFFVTEQAFKDNWDKSKTTRLNNFTNQEEKYTRLEQVIENMHLKADWQVVRGIPEGRNEQEMWEIFQKVYGQMHEGDELYIDLTHAFRYLPMLVLVLSNYAKFLKHVTVKYISYGNYEARDRSQEPNRAPIINLLALSYLQDWTSAATEYLKHGYAEPLKDMTKKSLVECFTNPESTPEAKANAGLVNRFATALETYTKDRIVCRGKSISEGTIAKKLDGKIQEIEDKLKEYTGLEPLNPIFETIRTDIKVSDNVLENCVDAAKWCFGKQLYQQAITLLEEGIVSFFCKRHGISLYDKDGRQLVNNAFSIRKKKENLSVGPKDDYQQKEEEILRDKLLANRELIDKFGDISDLRNDYNHAGFRAQHTPSDTIIKNIGNDIEALNKILKDQSQDKADLQRVFINISNHPSANWEEAQLQAARQYGDVVNYPFPQVPADATADNINALAERTAQRILELYPYTDITAHIMGEMTFTFALVTQLKAHGIRCVASCTDRVAENLGNGDKLSHFHFAQFREY